MKHIAWMGGIWKITDRNYQKLIEEIRANGEVNSLDQYGKMILSDPIDLRDLIQEIKDE